MKVHNDDTKAREKLFTELRMAKKQEDLAKLTTKEKAAAVVKHIIESFKDQLNNVVGQRFAIVFDGVFQSIITHGPRVNKTDLVSFRTSYIGVLSENPGEYLRNDVEQTSLNSYEISTAKLFVSGKGINAPQKDFEPVSGLWLKYYERGHPSWNVADVAAALAPDDIAEMIKSANAQKPAGTQINVTFYIGNTAFDDYIKTLKPKMAELAFALINEGTIPAA